MRREYHTTKSERVKIFAYHLAGLPEQVAAEELGVSISTVRKWINTQTQELKAVEGVGFNNKSAYYDNELDIFRASNPRYTTKQLKGEELQILNTLIMDKFITVTYTEPHKSSDGIHRIEITRKTIDGNKFTIAVLQGETREEVLAVQETFLNSIANHSSRITILKAE